MVLDLTVGTKIKIGKNYAAMHNFSAGQVIELIEGEFERDNGLYTSNESAPSIWNEGQKEFDSIYHLFGNDLEDFGDCKVIGIVDEFGNKWCNCEEPNLTHHKIPNQKGQAHCLNCQNDWYN